MNDKMIGNRYSSARTTPTDTAVSRTITVTPRLISAISPRYRTDPLAARSVGP
jgi:hypothetical protein